MYQMVIGEAQVLLKKKDLLPLLINFKYTHKTIYNNRVALI